MIIRNGKVFEPDGTFSVRDVYIKEHKLVGSIEEVNDTEVVDADGYLVIPGLVDIHSHGAVGHDFSDADAEGLKTILRYEKSQGITSYCPTSMTLSEEQLRNILSTVQAVSEENDGAVIRGINLEGPFLDPKKKGAHVEAFIRRPDAELFRSLNEVSGNKIKLVTLAPNMEGAMEFIEELKEDVCISLGHTSADYDTSMEAMKRGAHHVTHLYNAMEPFSHRNPGLIGAAADDPLCMVELISDGIHIHPSVVRATFRMFGPERVILISDSMRAAGMPNGTYELGGQTVRMMARRATLEDGTIAGSATCLFDCMKAAVSFGVPLEQALFAATRNPARSIGIDAEVGTLEPGKEADILLVTEDLELHQII